MRTHAKRGSRAIVAGLEDRIKAYAFIGVGGQTTWSAEERKEFAEDGARFPKGAAWARYVARVAVIDRVACVGYNKASAFLFLNGTRDWVAMRDAKAFLAATPEPKTWHV
jgi:hypothetical protein